MRQQLITTCTRDCTNTCGLHVTVENGRIVKVRGNPEHPFNQGSTCLKSSGFVERIYSPERVLTPLRKTNGRWQRIAWDEALDEIAHRLKDVRERFGPEAILYYQGFGERTALKLLNNRFFNLLGGVSLLTGTLCGGTGQASQNLDFGLRISHDPLDHLNSKSLILWGRNPVRTEFSLVSIIQQMRKAGGKVLLIDPVATESARISDRHIQPAPGTDLFLAMAAAKRVLSAGRVDHEFVRLRSEGCDAFCRMLDAFSVEELSRRCDVPLEQIDWLVEAMTSGRPASVILGWGMHRYLYAHESIRCIDALSAMTGNIGVPGGGVSQGFEEYGPYDADLMGFDLVPPRRKLLMPVIGEEILSARDPSIHMIFVTAGNPVCMAPNSGKVAKAFSTADFVVVVGHFLDDTADHADIFLPSTTFMEERDIVAGFGHNYVGPVNRVIEPRGECRSDFEIFKALAQRFPFAGDFNRSEDEWLSLLCRPLLDRGITFADLFRGPVRVPDAPMVPYADGIFPTPSGKYRFITQLAQREEIEEGVDDRLPYCLLSTVARDMIGSETTLAAHPPLPTVELHPDEAARLGLEDGDVVRVRSRVGAIKAELKLSPAIRRDVVVCSRGGWIKAGHGINVLTHDLVSKVGNGTPYFETRVAVEAWGHGE